MSQIITNAFSRYWQECLTNQTPVVLDEFVLAKVPGLDPEAPINPDSGLPPANQIVHRHAVDQRGRINNDAVAYTIVMDTTVGDFSFNAMYLINKATGVVGMIVHKGLETKLKTNEATGQTGNSLVKSMLMEYDRASEATATHVDASTWQIDYAARLRGMDDDLRLQALQFFGPATFYGNGFNLVNESGVYKVQPGVAYVGGLRAELNEVKKVTPGAKPVGLWLDIYRAGSLLDAWVNHFTLSLSVPDLVDYLDANGHQHHVAKVAIVNANGSVTDVRRKRTIELTGDVTGKGILEDAQGVTIAVEVKNNSHSHLIDNVEGLPQALAAPNAVATLATKLQDGADPLLPSGQLHALAWLVTGNSAEDLAQQLAILCALLPLPEWCATLRRLTANNDTMSQPTAAKVPRWRANEPLSWVPLRPARLALGATLTQLESLARDSQTPIARLQGLAARRTARLAQLAEALTKLEALSGTLWHWQGQGDAASLATQLGQSAPPDHSQSMTVAALLLSPSPLTFWQELTP
ncbi:hypothetical protein CAK78_20410 [Aeromonas sp. A35_P]|uniref:phage tail-collar fiber domain-containing protein n=1 Tax=Aeromonas sp. A35_P TaxID=1983805 RepID=UPI000B9B0947|nr:phage tail protein [Aeromonas sp. A35_P]OZG40113.1 hypothetical protein CAK78_20410 [Aeromonas sp. A35_P]